MEKKGKLKIPIEAVKRINACKKDKSVIKLDLSDLGLGYIPLDLIRISHLKSLSLRNNQIRKIENIPYGLTNLDLVGNQIQQIEHIPEKLIELDLAKNKIQKIENLPRGLEILKLSTNQITRIEGLPKGLLQSDLSNTWIIKIQELSKSLKTLDLRSNQISEIEGLPDSLNVLDLRGNEISKIGRLKVSLTHLYLSGNKISKIEGLPKGLIGLYLSGNDIRKIEGLPQGLTEFYLEGNKISKIEGLPESLTSLNLSDNQISKIGDLPATLTQLDLSLNMIKDQSELVNLIPFLESNQLSVFNIGANPFFDSGNFKSDLYVSGLFANHSQRLLSDLTFIKKQGEKQTQVITDIILPSKLLLLGNSDAGKSTLKQFLTNNQFANESIQSTDVLEVSRWKYDINNQHTYGFIYDFGGQDYFHGTYQLFFSQESVYTIIWDRQSNKNSKQDPTKKRPYQYYNYALGYWLGNINYLTNELLEVRKGKEKNENKESSAKQPQPVTLIENKIDIEHDSRHPILPKIEYSPIKDSFRISLKKTPKNVSAYGERRKLVKEHLKNELSRINDIQSFRTDHVLLIKACPVLNKRYGFNK